MPAPKGSTARRNAAIKAAATKAANKAAGIPPNAGRARASAQASTAYSAPSAGYAPPPPPPPPPSGAPFGQRAPASAPSGTRAPLWGTATKDARTLAYEGLALLEAAILAKFTAEKDATIKAALDTAFAQYQKIKARAIHPTTPPHEADTALRLAAIAAIKAAL